MNLLLLHYRNITLSMYEGGESGLYKTEFLEAFGNDYILTDIIPSTEIKRVEYKVEVTKLDYSWRCLFGSRTNSSNNPSLSAWIDHFNYLYNYYGDGDSSLVEILSVGEVIESNQTTSFTTDCTYPLSIFSINSNEGIGYNSISRIYYIRMYDSSNKLIHDLSPHYYENGRGCMKDLVTKKIYYSKNNLIIGKSKEQYEFCNYLLGPGNDYILTDIVPNSKFYKVQYKVSLVSSNNQWEGIFGCRNSTQSNYSYSYTVFFYEGKILCKGLGSALPTTGDEISIGDIIERSDVSTGSTFPSGPMAIFGLNDSPESPSVSFLSNIKIYYIKITDLNENVMHHLVPIKYNNKGAMLDMVTKKIYESNKGLITAGY